MIRLIVGTPIGRLTREAHNYHLLTRDNLGKLVNPATTNGRAYYGRDHMTAGSLGRFKPKLITLTRKEYEEALAEGYRLLDSVPLGRP